jgi:hypothetical protein
VGGQDEKEMTGWAKGTSSRRVKRSSMFRYNHKSRIGECNSVIVI